MANGRDAGRIKPIELARRLGISTSALRHYEAWGIVPPPERTASGYRIYTGEHAAYFTCIRAMLPGFGMDVAKEVMRCVRKSQADAALWIVNEHQARLHQDKQMAERTIRLLESEELDRWEPLHRKKWMSIGEMAAETGVPATAIRHWEKEGLLDLPRDEENGYRRLKREHYRQILIIRTLRSANHSLEVIKQVMGNLDGHDLDQARRIARESLSYLNEYMRHQARGIHALYELLHWLKLL